jgi:uncharacterized protein (TIGR02246 family)
MVLDACNEGPCNEGPEAEIRAFIDSWLNAVRAQDLDGIAAHYAPDILAFDAVTQLQFKGREPYREHWQACFAMSYGPMIFELHDLVIVAGHDVAFSYFLNRCGTVGDDGEEKASWMRGSAGYRRTGGRWTIVHEHFSAPFDMETGEALFDLSP